MDTFIKNEQEILEFYYSNNKIFFLQLQFQQIVL